MSSYVAPLVNAGISGALVYVPAYQLGYTAFQTSLIGFVARIIMNWIPGLNTFLMQYPSSLGASIPEGLFGLLLPLGLMFYKFGFSGVLVYILVALLPLIIFVAFAGFMFVAAGPQKKN